MRGLRIFVFRLGSVYTTGLCLCLSARRGVEVGGGSDPADVWTFFFPRVGGLVASPGVAVSRAAKPRRFTRGAPLVAGGGIVGSAFVGDWRDTHAEAFSETEGTCRRSVFETPRIGDHGSGEGGAEAFCFGRLSRKDLREVVDAAGEAYAFPVDRFAGDRRSARWSLSRLACASTWILSLRISSRASPRLV